MTFWWKCHDGHTSHNYVTTPDFNDQLTENLIGLWEFSSDAKTADTGLADGIAQNGHFHGNAYADGGAAKFDGSGDYFDVSGTDTPFDMDEGTIQVQFTQTSHIGSSADTLVNRGEYNDRDTEGFFDIEITRDGAVVVNHFSGSDSLSLSTANGFFDEGDEVRVSYSWDDDGQGSFIVENLTDGTTHEATFDSTGLNMDVGDNDDENFTFGAREVSDGSYDHYFNGEIAYVAVFDDPALSVADGIVSGTTGDDLIDTAYTGDPDGDLIDNNDALLPGETGDDDIVDAGDGNDTILSGAGDDEVYGGAGDDTIDGGTGDDLIYGDDNLEGGIASGTVLTGTLGDGPGSTGGTFGDHSGGQTVYDGQHSFTTDAFYLGNDIPVLSDANDDVIDGVTYGVGGVDVNGNPTDRAIELQEISFTGAQRGFYGHEVVERSDLYNSNDQMSSDGTNFQDIVSVNTGDVKITMNDGTVFNTIEVTFAQDADGNTFMFPRDGEHPDAFNSFLNLLNTNDSGIANFEILHVSGTQNGIFVMDGNWADGQFYEEAEAGEPGDDIIDGGEGNDTIYGQEGSDTIDGGEGDDTIYGDNGGETVTYTQGTFSWADQDDTDAYGSGTVDHGEDIEGETFVDTSGGVTVTVTTPQEYPTGVESDFSTSTINDDGLDDPIDDNSSVVSLAQGGETGTYTVDFSDPVENVEFNVTDIDADLGQVTVIAYDAGGNQIPVDFDIGSGLGQAGNTVTANGTNNVDPTADSNTATISIDGPVSSIEIIHSNPGNGTSGIHISDINYDVQTIVGDTEETVGDDIITGGAGSDAMFGEGGDDTFIVSSASDADGDTVDGGNGIDETTDNDTLDLRGAGNVTINAVADDNDDGAQKGTVTFENGEVLTFEGIETILTDPQNEAPTINDDTATVAEDGSVTIPVLDNDVDPDGDDLTITSATVTQGEGTVDIVNGELVFTPAPDFNGPVEISYTAEDPTGESGTATVSIDVTPVNDAPDAVNDTVSTPEDGGPITIDVLDNDTDVDGDPLSITGASVPSEQGTVDIVNGELVFTPAEDFNGPATISYSIEDGAGGTDTAEVTVNVTPVNDDPEAVDDIASTDEETPVVVDLLGNDTDVDGDPLTLGTVSVPAEQGEVVDNGDGTVTFTPAENFNGPATITYTVLDGQGGEDEGQATVNVAGVIDPPEAVDDTAVTDEDTPITIDVLDNDTDPENDPLTITSATVPADQGTVDIVNNELVFTPAENFNGEATITYAIEDDENGTDTAEVTVTVNPVNDDPVAVDDNETTDEDQEVIIDLLGNDTDVDGDPLSIGEVSVDPALGTVVDNGDGTVTFTPAPDYNGPVTIDYTVIDGQGGEDAGQAVVSVGAVNDAPVANDDSDTTQEDTAITVDLLDNDTDPDGDDLTVIQASVPVEHGTLVDNGDGTVTFTPAEDFNGDATISYTIADGNGGTDTGEHTVTVTAENDAPESGDDTAEVPEDGSVTIPVLDNDIDPDGDELTVTEATSPDGDVTINPDGTITFEPNPDFNGPTTITYTVEDPDGAEDTATVQVNVTPVNDAPVAEDDTATTAFDTPVTIPVLDNDVDVDGDELTVTEATSPDGDVTINPDGTITFEPTPGFEGTATITYTVEDPDGAEDTGVVTVTVEDQPLDGIVQGTENADLIDVNYTGDPQGDMVDNNDAILPGEAPNDDIILAGGGDDTVLAGEGDDTVEGGTGDDTIIGGAGNDTINDEEGSDTVDGGEGDDVIDVAGGDSPDTIAELLALTDPNGLSDLDYSPYSEVIPVDDDPTDDIDNVNGGAGNDTIITGDDADRITAGDGNDTIYSGIDDDYVEGGAGDDYIEDVQGADYIDGGDGNDTIIAGFDTLSDYANGFDGDDANIPSAGYPFPNDQNQTDGQDTVLGGAGDDIIFTGDDADTVYGGADNDTIDAGIDDDFVDGGTGDDTIFGGHGSDTIYGGEGNDYIDASDTNGVVDHTNEDDATDPFANNDVDTVYGGAGNDTIIGGDDNDVLYGDEGNDTISGGLDDDEIHAGAGTDFVSGDEGDDTIYGGGENDTLSGGDDQDTIYVTESATGPQNTTVLGGDGGVDWDTLDFSDLIANGWVVVNHVQNVDSDGNGFDGQIQLINGSEGANINYTNIEQVIPCFTPGTLIATPEGERAVEGLAVGDKVITRDNGMQTIRWVGAKRMSAAELALRPELKAIRISQGALGNGLPERDMIVSPNHRMLVTSERAALLFEDYEVLVAAKHLLGRDGVEELDARDVTYIHIMFDRHEVVLSDGTWSESFQPGDYTLAGIGEESREELFAIFPELRDITQRGDYVTARRVLRKHEAALLVE